GGLKGDEYIDRLKIVKVEDEKTIRKVGHNLFEVAPEHPQPVAAEDFNLRQGAIEKSNVNSITMLRNMIDIMRTYEANQRVILTQDELIGRAVNDVARV
ncbi:MAG: flagellar basal body rod C-terminal domain-containing protein, partial [bacterium]